MALYCPRFGRLVLLVFLVVVFSLWFFSLVFLYLCDLHTLNLQTMLSCRLMHFFQDFLSVTLLWYQLVWLSVCVSKLLSKRCYQLLSHWDVGADFGVWCCFGFLYVWCCLQDNWTALHVASQNGHEEIVRLLVSSGSDVTALTSVGVLGDE